MTTAVSTAFSGGGLITREALKQSLGNVAREMPRVNTGGVDFLGMAKDGEWSYGIEGNVVDPDSIWAVNPGSLEHGWIAWKEKLGQEPIGEVMVSAMRPLPDKTALVQPTEGKGWQQQYGVQLVCVEGPDLGAHVLYKNTSVGAIKLFNKYIDELMARVEADSDDLVALVKITSESYMHKEWKKTFNPIFDYVEWRPMDDTSAPEAPVEEPKAEEPVTAKRTRAPNKPKPAVAETKVEETAVEDDTTGDDGDQGDNGEGGEEEDEEDRLIREALARKEAKRLAAAAPAAETATEAADDTPRRRVRRP